MARTLGARGFCAAGGLHIRAERPSGFRGSAHQRRARPSREAGITIRTLDPPRPEAELQRIFKLSLSAFSRNFLYTPIAEAEFLAQYQAVLPHVRPELVLLAEKEDALVGFMFAIPDLLQARRGVPIDTVILKTIAVDPAMSGLGLGGALMDLVQRRARALGFDGRSTR